LGRRETHVRVRKSFLVLVFFSHHLPSHLGVPSGCGMYNTSIRTLRLNFYRVRGLLAPRSIGFRQYNNNTTIMACCVRPLCLVVLYGFFLKKRYHHIIFFFRSVGRRRARRRYSLMAFWLRPCEFVVKKKHVLNNHGLENASKWHIIINHNMSYSFHYYIIVIIIISMCAHDNVLYQIHKSTLEYHQRFVYRWFVHPDCSV